MSRQILVILAAAGALSVVPANAVAAPITATQLLSFSLTDTLETAGAADITLQFDQFDASLGTLTQVVLSVGDPYTNQLLVMHGIGSPANVANPGLATSVVGIPLVPSVPLPQMSGLCSFCSVASADRVETFFSGVAITYPVASQPNLGVPFIGNGMLSLILSAMVSGTVQNATVTGTWSGNVRLDYTYEPAPATVPEPASLLLLGTVVSAVAWRRGRRT